MILDFFYRKPVIGTEELITIIFEKNYETIAKIDTGALTSSVDMSILESIGFDEPIRLINDERFIKESNDDKYKQRGGIDKESRVELLKDYPNIVSIGRVYSSNGYRLTPFFNLKLKVGNTVFTTLFNLADRSTMKYQVLLGRKSLRKFLIDVDRDYLKMRDL